MFFLLFNHGNKADVRLVGCSQRMSYTALGDMVNAASAQIVTAGETVRRVEHARNVRILQGMARPRSEICKTQYEYAFALEQSAVTAAVKGS